MARAPSPALPAPSLERRLESGIPDVVVLAGSERWFREEALRAIVARVLPEGDPGASFLRYDARRPEDREGVSAAVDDVRTPSLFGASGRVVAVDNAEAAGGPWGTGKASPVLQLATAAAGAGATGAVLVLLTPRPVKGSGSIPAKKLVDAGALVVDCRSLYDDPGPWRRGAPAYEHELSRYLAERLARVHGKRMSLPEAHAITRLVGSDLAALDGALEALALYVGQAGEVRAEDVDAALGSTRSDPAWKLVDAVMDGDREAAMDRLEAAFDRGLPDSRGGLVHRPDAIFMFLTASLHGAWRRVLAGAEGLARGEQPPDVARAQGIPPFRADAWLARCRRDPREMLERHEAFFEAERRVKGGGASARLALTELVVRLSERGDPALARRTEARS